jgi:hypothetical protein
MSVPARARAIRDSVAIGNAGSADGGPPTRPAPAVVVGHAAAAAPLPVAHGIGGGIAGRPR